MPNHRIFQRIAKSNKFFKISIKAQLLYLLGFAFLDDYGVWTADPHEIWRDIFVDHKTIKNKEIVNLLEELAEVKLINIYAVDGKLYQQYEKFEDFQTFGRGYNRKSIYPDFKRIGKDGCSWVYSGVRGCIREYVGVNDVNGSMPYSLSNTNTNTHSYKEEDIDKLVLEEKSILKCFYALGFKLKEKDLESWNKWILELKKDYKDKDLVANAKKWRDYFEQKPPKNFKNSFRNWVAKPYADSKPHDIIKYDEASRKFEERYGKTIKK